MPDLLVPLAPGPAPTINPLGVEVGVVYTLIGPDGTRAVINDPADRDFVGYLSGEDGVTGLERAGVRQSVDALPEADGQVFGAFRYEGLSFTLKGIVPPDAISGGSWLTRQAKLKRATNAMLADGRLLWTPSEAPPVFVNFRQAQPTRITGRRPKAFLIAGVCEDNVAYSQELHTDQAIITAGSVLGFASPLASPLGSAPNSGPNVITVTNRGDAPAWPVLTVYGPITNPVLTNATTGKAIRLTATLAAGEYITVDTNPRRRSIYRGTVNAYSAYNFAASAWWALLGGDNVVTLTASASSPGAYLVVQWRDAWG